jgi:uncharacterized membrane protein YkvA (DUF1232 family)
MADKNNIITSQNTGFFHDLVRHIKLIARLMGDKRVPFLLKLLPVGTLIYLISPIDIAPGLALPVIGALDDAAIIWLGSSLFIFLCPDNVVQEHLAMMDKVIDTSWKEAKDSSSADLIDGEARDEK